MSTIDIRLIDEDEIIDNIIISEDYELQELDGGRKGVSLHIYGYEFLVKEDECRNLIKALEHAKTLAWW